MASTAEKKRAQAEEGEDHGAKPSSEEVSKRQRRSTGEGENDAANEQGGEGVRQKQGGGDAGEPPTASGVIEEGAIEFFYRWITQAWWRYIGWMLSTCPFHQYSRDRSQFPHLPRLRDMHARPPVQHHATNKELSLRLNCRRPKVGVNEANSLDEVQRFFMLLRPRMPGATKNRLCVIGKKRMPSARKHEVGGVGGGQGQPVGAVKWAPPSHHRHYRPHLTHANCAEAFHLQRFFGFVQASSENAEELREGLGPQQYETKTRGNTSCHACVTCMYTLPVLLEVEGLLERKRRSPQQLCCDSHMSAIERLDLRVRLLRLLLQAHATWPPPGWWGLARIRLWMPRITRPCCTGECSWLDPGGG
jgi:hypothetical protein